MDPPPGWEIRYSKSRPGMGYYYNPITKQSLWEYPHEEIDNEQNQHNDQVRVRHILVKHSGSRRPSSHRQAAITRTKTEAIEMIREYQGQIMKGEFTFEQLAREHSDCSSANQGGDLGFFGKGKMQKPFEEASFALNVGQISGPVETDSGIHLIYREA
jgi:NIMA-interacting peptidyl-prolyl cis-trans isomerase 1